MLVLDSGGLSRLAQRSRHAQEHLIALREAGLWPPVVPSPVLVESLAGDPRRDTSVNRFLKTCDIHQDISERLARRAAHLRSRARQGSAVDAIVVALAEGGGVVVTQDVRDMNALASHANDVSVLRI